MKPEERARETIDEMLRQSGWIVQDRDQLNLGAGQGVAVREFGLATGDADYLLFVDRRAVGTVEAKKVGQTLTGVEEQSAKYRVGLPPGLPAARDPLPFAYETTGVETRFTTLLDPEPRSRPVFAFHRPETLADWLKLAPDGVPTHRERDAARPAAAPAAAGMTGLRDCQVEAITNLERSLAENRPRALIQMATGSGKTYTAVSSIYRLIKYRRREARALPGGPRQPGPADAQRVPAVRHARRRPQVHRAVQRPALADEHASTRVAEVCITTIQRLYSHAERRAETRPEDVEEALALRAG